MTDCMTLDEYEVELERRRQIGLTIDSATAETTFWWADGGDPYYLLGERYHWDSIGRERFARNPGGGGDWVNFADLPEATRTAIWERDGRKLMFPYGLFVRDEDDLDSINRPPGSRTSPPT